jgi:hypothetical protein
MYCLATTCIHRPAKVFTSSISKESKCKYLFASTNSPRSQTSVFIFAKVRHVWRKKFWKFFFSANSTNFDKFFFQFCQYLNTRKMRKKTENKTKHQSTGNLIPRKITFEMQIFVRQEFNNLTNNTS